MFTGWMSTCKAEWLQAVPAGIRKTLDTLEELVAPEADADKYVFMGHLLREGKRLGLISAQEYSQLQEFIVGPHGWR